MNRDVQTSPVDGMATELYEHITCYKGGCKACHNAKPCNKGCKCVDDCCV